MNMEQVKCYSDGSKYIGHFSAKGKRNGYGSYFWANGDYYKGYWENGLSHGQGEMYWANGDVYIGNFQNGQMSGKGKKIQANKDCYEGEWKDGKAEGQGRKTFAVGDSHVGEYKNDKRNGFGTYYWASGLKFQGIWVNGIRHGEGVEVDIDGRVYRGEWRNGLKDGVGILSDKNKTIREEWKEDKLISSQEIDYISPQKLENNGSELLKLTEYVARLEVTVEELKKNDPNRKKENTCSVCLVNEIDCVLVGCGHMCCCMDCSKPIHFCPICRANIVQRVKIFRV